MKTEYYFNTFLVTRQEFKELYKLHSRRGVDTPLSILFRRGNRRFKGTSDVAINYCTSSGYVFKAIRIKEEENA